MKIGLISLGCPKNLVDSEVMLGLLQESGYELISDEHDADILIINTCAFIEDAIQESLDTIFDCIHNNRHRKVVVAGCLAQRYAHKLAAELPEVSAFVGTGEFQNIARVCNLLTKEEQQSGENTQPLIFVSPPQYLYDHATPRILSTPKHYAYLKIAEGCDNRCSFCLIPQLRGVHRSRSIVSLLMEANHLADAGVRELVLISQDSTAYGFDTPSVTQPKGMDATGRQLLPTLLQELVHVDGIKWIRVLYAYPNLVDEALLEVIATEPKVCTYLDIPIQHIHDEILRKMIRRTTSAQLRAKIERIKRIVPDITLRSTVIVGFPRETETHFATLCDFIQKTEFDHLGVFAYSQEMGTPAARMKGQVPEAIKRERVDRLVEIQQQIAFQKRQRYIGQNFTVLVDSIDEAQNFLVARTEGQAPEIDDVVYIPMAKKTAAIGTFLPVRIVATHEYDLIGEVMI